MSFDFSGIIQAKLAQMEEDGTIQKKIEEALEKSVLAAVTSELESYSFRRSIEEQLRNSTSGIAEKCGLASYNGFIVEKMTQIVRSMYTEDLAEKAQKALSDVLVAKYEGIKLSDIFERYRDWVCRTTEDSEKYDRQEFTADLEVSESGCFTSYRITFADEPAESRHNWDKPDIQIRFFVYQDKEADSIASLWLRGQNVKETVALGYLTEFEAFLVNLYYNNTPIILDQVDPDEYKYFDVDI